MIIDAHHHFWKYDPVTYGWIGDEMKEIRKDFLPSDLKKTIEKAGVTKVISVQARQCLEETDWLLKFADENDYIAGVTGWVPLADGNIDEVLGRYKGKNKLKAVRHVVQDEPDPEFILGEKFNRGVSLLLEYGLVYEILVFEKQLPNAIRFVDRHPLQQFVLDHIAKPKIKEGLTEPWKKNITELAKRENVSCKISGMVTEASLTGWTEDDLLPYVMHVLEAFGPDRVMFGSDWPVCLSAVSYVDWLDLVKKWISPLGSDEQKSVLYKNAVNVYKLR